MEKSEKPHRVKGSRLYGRSKSQLTRWLHLLSQSQHRGEHWAEVEPRKLGLENFKNNFSQFFHDNCQRELNSQKLFRIPAIAIGIVGFISYKSVLTTNFKYSNAEEVMRFLAQAFPTLSCAVLIAHTMINQFQTDAYEALAEIPVLLAGSLLTLQAARYYFWRDQIHQLLRDLMSSWNAELKLGISEEVAKSAKRGIMLTRGYFIAVTMAGCTYFFRPITAWFFGGVSGRNESYMDITVLPTSYPFAMDSLLKYFLCNIWEGFTIFNAVVCWTAFDGIFVQCTTIVSLQMQVIGDKLRAIVQETDLKGNDTGLMNRLMKIGEQHSEVLKYCEKMENLFNPPILMIMVVTSLSMCIALVTVEKELFHNNYLNVARGLLTFFTVLVQASVYCIAASNVSHWTESIVQAAFDCQWIDCSSKFKKMIVLIIMRGQSPHIFQAYGFYTVNRVQLTRVLMLTNNFFALMRSIKSLTPE